MDQSAMLKEFFEVLYSEYFRNYKGVIEVKLLEDSQKKRLYPDFRKVYSGYELLVKDLPRLKKEAISTKDYEPGMIMFGVCPREGNGYDKKSILSVPVIWMDIDGKDLNSKNIADGKKQAVELIKKFELKPTVIIDSGNGYHCYWRMKEVLRDVPRAELIMRKLKVVLHGDSTQNADRSLRMPTTFNYKNKEKPKQVRILKIEKDNIYTAEDFERVLAGVEISAPETTAQKIEINLNTVIDEKWLEDLLRSSKKIRGLYTGETQIKAGSWSENDYHLALQLSLRGYDCNKIAAIIIKAEYQKERARTLTVQRLEKTISKAEQAAKKFKEEKEDKEQNRYDIDRIRLDKDIKSPLIKKRAISKEIIDSLKEDGVFHKIDTGDIFYFSTKFRKLYAIYSTEFKAFLNDTFGLNSATGEYLFVEKEIETECHIRGIETEIYDFCHYDQKKNVLFIYDNDNTIYRIDREGIKETENGSGGMLFFKRADREKICVADDNKLEEGHSLLADLLFNKINFSEGPAVTAQEQKLLFEMYFYTLFFESAQHDKPITVFIGEKGSGKSKAFEMVGTLLFGKHFRLKPKPNDINDVKDNASSSYLYIMDNLDGRIDHLLDIIASIATRMGITRRKLYTDNDMVNVDPKAFIGITCRTPRFNRDDISDRMLFFRVDRLKHFTGASSLMGGLIANRPKIWREIMNRLHQIVKTLEWSKDEIAYETKFRVADFANLLFRMCDQQVWNGNEVYKILDKMIGEQTKFTLEDNSIFLALEEYMDHPTRRNGFEIDTTELYKELKTISEDNGMPFPINARSFGIQLKQIMSDLMKYWTGTFTIEEHRGSKNRKVIEVKKSK